MSKHLANSIFILFSIAMVPKEAYAIRTRTAAWASGITGLGGSLFAGVASPASSLDRWDVLPEGEDATHAVPVYVNVEGEEDSKPVQEERFMRPAPADPGIVLRGGFGSVAGGLTYGALYWFTPPGRVVWASWYLAQIGANPLAARDFKNGKKLVNAIKGVYAASDLWLVEASHDLPKYLTHARKAIALLRAACADAQDPVFIKQAKARIVYAQKAAARVTRVLKIVHDLPTYLEQMRVWKTRGMIARWRMKLTKLITPPREIGKLEDGEDDDDDDEEAEDSEIVEAS